MLSQQPPQQAEYLADQLSHALLTTTMLEISGQPLKISASIGIASMSDAIFQTPIELIEAADRSMYLAKRSGRGRTMLFDGNRWSIFRKGISLAYALAEFRGEFKTPKKLALMAAIFSQSTASPLTTPKGIAIINYKYSMTYLT